LDKLTSANQTIERLKSDKPVDHGIGDLQVREGEVGERERGEGRRGKWERRERGEGRRLV